MAKKSTLSEAMMNTNWSLMASLLVLIPEHNIFKRLWSLMASEFFLISEHNIFKETERVLFLYIYPKCPEKTMKTQVRCCRMQCLIRVYTVCHLPTYQQVVKCLWSNFRRSMVRGMVYEYLGWIRYYYYSNYYNFFAIFWLIWSPYRRKEC